MLAGDVTLMPDAASLEAYVPVAETMASPPSRPVNSPTR